MHKIIHIFLLLFSFNEILNSKEPTLAILVDIKSNDMQRFKIGNYHFDCLSYGIIGMDELYKSETADDKCKKSIKQFYVKRPDLRYYTYSKLKVMQLYSLGFKNDRCVIYASGGKSLSEFLLEEGLAVRKPSFKDPEFEHYFYKSQEKAKILKRGIWGGNVINDCKGSIGK